MSARIAIAMLTATVTGVVWAQDARQVVVDPAAAWGRSCGGDTLADRSQIYLGLTVHVQGVMTEAQRRALREHLEDVGTYRFTSDWPAVANLQPLNSANPPFVLVRARATERLDLVCLLGRDAYQTRGENRFDPVRTRGEIHLDPMPAASGMTLAVRPLKPVPGVTPRPPDADGLTVLYTTGEQVPLPKLRRSVDIGVGKGGPTLEVSYSGLVGGRPELEQAAPDLLELSLDARLPIGTPKDVQETPGAQSDASEKIADMLSAELAWVNYSRLFGLQRAGGRVRATGSGEGVEVTGFYSPFVRWFNGSRALVAAEAELGWREGDAEFKDLTTRAPDRGNLVARLGGVAEWAPEFLGINKNLSEGLRFFVRARGWLDTFDNDQGKQSVRFAKFLDAEFFYNFTKDSRVFVRAEYGELPPDLSNHTERVFVGVGQAF